MNPITFNKNYLRFVEDAPYKSITKVWKEMEQSPLILWQADCNKPFTKEEQPEAFHDNGCPRLPFSRMRVSGTFRYMEMPAPIKFKAWLAELENFKEVLITDKSGRVFDTAGQEIKGSGPGLVIVMELSVLFNTPVPIMDTYSGAKLSGSTRIISTFAMYSSEMGKNTCSVNNVFYDPSSGVVNETESFHNDKVGAIFTLKWVNRLCMDFQNPKLYVCKVSPPLPKGHQVMWQKAREHYVLIHSSHTVNSKKNLGKNVVHDSTDSELIDRVAHSRRAHTRLLRSSRFVHKKGMRIKVKSTWVGPKEWTDHSGQIYQIVDDLKPK